MQQVAAFSLGENAELRLMTDSNLSQVELYYGGLFQELAATANTGFVVDIAGRIVSDGNGMEHLSQCIAHGGQAPSRSHTVLHQHQTPLLPTLPQWSRPNMA